MSDKSVKVTLALKDKITKPLRDVQKRFDKFSDQKFRWASALKGTFQGIAQESGLNKLTKNASDIHKNITKIGGAALTSAMKLGGLATLGVGGMLALVKQTADAGDGLVNVAKRIDFGVEAFQEYQFAAEQSGVSQEDFVKGVENLTRKLGEAKAGQGQLFGFLKQTNPALLKQVLAAKSNEQAFELMLNSLGKVKDAQKQAAYAAFLFGKSGKNFTNLANEGSDGIAKLRDTARSLGIMTEKQAVQADNFGDTWASIERIFAGVRNTVSMAIIPLLQQLAESFIAFFQKNREAIQKFATEFAANLSAAIGEVKQILTILKVIFFPLISAVKLLGSTFGYVKVAAIILAATVGKGLVVALWTLNKVALTAAFSVGKVLLFALFQLATGLKVVATALFCTPFGLVFTILGLLPIALIMLYKAWKSNWLGIRDIFSSVYNWIADKLSKLVDKFISLKKYLPSWLGGGDSKTEIKLDKTQRIVNDGIGVLRPQENVNSTASAIGTAQAIKNYVVAQPMKNETSVKVSFDNLPQGAKVETDSSKNVNLKTEFNMGMLGLPSY